MVAARVPGESLDQGLAELSHHSRSVDKRGADPMGLKLAMRQRLSLALAHHAGLGAGFYVPLTPTPEDKTMGHADAHIATQTDQQADLQAH